MFMNLFIGNPSQMDSPETNPCGFSIVSLRNGNKALKNCVSGRYLTLPKKGLKDDISYRLLENRCPSALRASSYGCETSLAYTSMASVVTDNLHMVLDSMNLNPRLNFYDREKDTETSQIFVNIDTDLFTPIIYDLPENSVVKDTYHYGKHFCGFVLEVSRKICSEEAASILKIYGYDKRLPETNKMSRFVCIKLSIDSRYATDEEMENMRKTDPIPENERAVLHVASTMASGINETNKTTFFRVRNMYNKNSRARLPKLSGPLFTTNIIGTLPMKDAREKIQNAKVKNGIAVNQNFNYYCISKEGFKDDEDWYQNEVVKLLNEFKEMRIRAITVIGKDINLNVKSLREARIQEVLLLEEDGTIRCIISTR